MTHHYSAFGLTMESDIRFGELRTCASPPREVDVRVVATDLGVALGPFGSAPSIMDFSDGATTLMAWHGVCAVRITPPGLIEVQTYPGVPEPYLGFPVLGPVMGWLLHRRGLFVLHASALDDKGRTIGFLGDKGAGKSTTAAALVSRGATLLTDDLLVVDTSAEPPMVQPAFGQIKLMAADADVHAIDGATALPLVFEDFPKRQFRTERTDGRPRPCDYLLVLERGGTSPALDWLDPAAALRDLVRFSYAIRFPDAPADQWDREGHFRRCAAMLRHVKIGRFAVPHDLDRLDEAMDVLDHALPARRA